MDVHICMCRERAIGSCWVEGDERVKEIVNEELNLSLTSDKLP